MTSPPYYALRDYGKENQIGREGAPEEYIGHLVSVFCELKRVLRSDGTFWLNIADCYSRKSYQAKRIDGTSVAAGTYPEKRGLVSSQ